MEFEDTPLFDWLKKNRLFLLVLLIGILAIAANERFGPTLRNNARIQSWSLYQTVINGLDLDDNLASSLQLAREDDRIFPWVVFSATKTAILQRNTSALATLKPELESLSASAGGDSLRVNSDGEAVPIATFLLDRVNEIEAGGTKTFANPEATGSKVKLVVTDSLDTVYELVIATYEDAAPGSCEQFLAAVEAGTFDGEEIQTFGGRSIKVTGLGAESSAPLERDFGYFHLAGALSMIPKPGKPGEHETDSIQILLEDNTFGDGDSTVFAVIIDGLEAFRSAVQAAAADTTFTVTSTTIL